MVYKILGDYYVLLTYGVMNEWNSPMRTLSDYGRN